MPNKVSLALTMLKISQAAICDATGWTPSKLSKIVNGYTKAIDVADCRELSSLLGCAVEDLFPAREAVAS